MNARVREEDRPHATSLFLLFLFAVAAIYLGLTAAAMDPCMRACMHARLARMRANTSSSIQSYFPCLHATLSNLTFDSRASIRSSGSIFGPSPRCYPLDVGRVFHSHVITSILFFSFISILDCRVISSYLGMLGWTQSDLSPPQHTHSLSLRSSTSRLC